MITSAPDAAQLEQWKKLWQEQKDFLVPNRKNGQQLIDYLFALYNLEEISDREILDTVAFNVTESTFFCRKLAGGEPRPRAFFVKDSGNGARLYQRRSEIYADVECIIVGIEMTSGCFYVEGSEQLWDELCAYQGVDEDDLGNYVRTAQYIECLQNKERIIGKRVTVTVDRPLGSAHPKHNDIIYPVNYGYVKGIAAPDGDEQDAYILGVDFPVERFDGIVTAVIVRANDCEDKWVVVPDGVSFSQEDITAAVAFQEQYFDSQIII